MLNSGPPELPLLIGASVWKKSSYGPERMLRPLADRMPAVTEPPRPNGLPMASTQSPTRILSESAHFAAGSGCLASTFSTATSVFGSRPIIFAGSSVSSCRMTVTSSASAMTWLLVTTRPLESMMKPEPSDMTGPRGRLPRC